MRPGDHAGANDRGAIAQGLPHGPLAEHLEPAVGFARDHLDRRIIELHEALDVPALAGARLGAAWVDRDRGHEQVLVGVLGQQLARGPHDPGRVAAHVDDRVEAFPGVEQLLDLVQPAALARIAVASQAADGRRQLVGFGSVQDGDGVTGVGGLLDERAAAELGATEDEDVHG